MELLVLKIFGWTHVGMCFLGVLTGTIYFIKPPGPSNIFPYIHGVSRTQNPIFFWMIAIVELGFGLFILRFISM